MLKGLMLESSPLKAKAWMTYMHLCLQGSLPMPQAAGWPKLSSSSTPVRGGTELIHTPVFLASLLRAATPSFRHICLVPPLVPDFICSVLVPMYGWNSYLSQFFRKLPSTKPLHLTECRMDGSVMCKLLKCDPDDVPC